MPGTYYSSQEIAQLAAMGGAAGMQAPPLPQTLAQAMFYSPQTPAGLHAAQNLGPAVLNALVSPQTPILGALTQGAMNRSAVMNAVGGIAFPGGAGPLGMGFGAGEREQIFQQVRRQQIMPEATIGELAQTIQAGVGMGAFTSVRTVQEFKQKFDELLKSVKTVTQVLGTSLQESLQMMQQVRGMGFFGAGGAQALTGFQGMSYAAGIPVSAMMEGAQMALPGMRAAGMRMPQATMAAMRFQRTMGAAYTTGVLGDEELMSATGMTAEAGGIQAFGAQFLARSAHRMRRMGRGGYLTAAMLDPETGGIDPEMMAGLRAGTLSTAELQQQAHRRAGQYGQLDWTVNRNRLSGQVLEREPLAEMMFYRNYLQERGVTDMTSSMGRLQLSRLSGMSLEETEAMAPVLQNIDKIRITEQVRTAQARHVAQAGAGRRIGGGAPEFLSGMRDRVQKWVDALEKKGEELGRTLEDVMRSRLEDEIGMAEGFIQSDFANILSGGTAVIGTGDTARAARITKAELRQLGAEFGRGAPSGRGRWYQPATGVNTPEEALQMGTLYRMMRPESYIRGTEGQDVGAVAEEARRRVAAMDLGRQEYLTQRAREANLAHDFLSKGFTEGRHLITDLPPELGRRFDEINRMSLGEQQGQLRNETERTRLKTEAAASILWRQQMSGGSPWVQQEESERVRTNEFLDRLDRAGGISASMWEDPFKFQAFGETGEIGGVQLSEALKSVSTQGKSRAQIKAELLAAMEQGALGSMITPERLAQLEVAAGFVGESGGLGVAAFLPGSEVTAALHGPGGLRTRFQKGAEAVGGEWTGEALRNFVIGASGVGLKLGEESVRGGVLTRDSKSLIQEALNAYPDSNNRVLFNQVLGKIPGLTKAEVDSLTDNPDLARSLDLGNGMDRAGLEQAINAVKGVTAGLTALSDDTIQSIYGQLFSGSADTVKRLEERFQGDASMAGLINRVRDISEGGTQEGVAALMQEVFIDPEQRTRKLGALAGAGFELGRQAEAIGSSVTQLERGRGKGRGFRQGAVLDLLSNVMDVTSLRARGITPEDIGRAVQGRPGMEGIQSYIESGKWDTKDMITAAGGVFEQVAASAAQGRNEATKAQEELPEKIGQAMKKAMEGMTWDITITGALTQGENPVDTKSDKNAPGGTGSGASGSFRVQSGQAQSP